MLVPRPETEVLVGEVLSWVADRGGSCVALDLGTGSGAIALSLLAEGPFERVVATDVSAGALEVAGANAR
ncbi:MAG: methyltransferase, partial [Gemmatimonadetes bacterium]|nr:methyltransferase [Gemmatimonadota bacterium]NIQ58031.1 methyltransferase [Gemmatimonadota bacterium]NIU78214.1 methyltransferase [Gammaproteobacteria bacterium]NIX47203.1 methyltransferase [Gemmatimonadota bacterium]NIY11579.1 methyltransferase [Gemmatimonadota bacterium]